MSQMPQAPAAPQLTPRIRYVLHTLYVLLLKIQKNELAALVKAGSFCRCYAIIAEFDACRDDVKLENHFCLNAFHQMLAPARAKLKIEPRK
jgi:hypothetical protein